MTVLSLSRICLPEQSDIPRAAAACAPRWQNRLPFCLNVFGVDTMIHSPDLLFSTLSVVLKVFAHITIDCLPGTSDNFDMLVQCLLHDKDYTIFGKVSFCIKHILDI